MNDKIPSKFLNEHSISSDIELIAVEFHQNKCKWLSLCVYKPPNQNESVFVEAIGAISAAFNANIRFISPYKGTDMFPIS